MGTGAMFYKKQANGINHKAQTGADWQQEVPLFRFTAYKIFR